LILLGSIVVSGVILYYIFTSKSLF